MNNEERIQENNNGLQECLALANSLPGAVYDVATFDVLLTIVEGIIEEMPILTEKRLAFSVANWTDTIPSGVYFATVYCGIAGQAKISVSDYSSSVKLHNRRGSGIWVGWEWENPPMHTDEEYRTTEKHNDDAVYTQLLDFGYLPKNTSKKVYFSDEAVGAVISCEIITDYQGQGFAGHVGQIDYFYAHTDGYVDIKTTVDMSGVSAYALLKYTKE